MPDIYLYITSGIAYLYSLYFLKKIYYSSIFRFFTNTLLVHE